VSRAPVVLGALIALAGAGSLPIALSLAAPPVDLEVTVSPKSARVVRDMPGRVLPDAIVAPPRAARRLSRNGALEPDATGLALRTWSLTYGERWEREVSVPVLTGPFAKEGTDVCSFAMRVGAGLFNTRGAGAGIAKLVRARLDEAFPTVVREPNTGITLAFPAVRDLDLRLVPRQGTVAIKADVRLVDSTRFTASFEVRLRATNGTPIIERASRVTATWEGPTRALAIQKGADYGAQQGDAMGQRVGCIFGDVGCQIGGALGQAIGSAVGEHVAKNAIAEGTEAAVTARLDDALGNVSLGLEHLTDAWHPLADRPNDTVSVRLAGDPIVSPNAMVLPLCARVAIAEPKRDASIEGSVFGGAPLPAFYERPDPIEDDTSIELRANADGIDQLFYLLWQSGMLRELGTSTAALDAMPRDVQALAFDVTGFDPGLPPTVDARGAVRDGALPLVLADVGLGTWDARRVRAHAHVWLSLEGPDGALTPSLALGDVTADCVEDDARATHITPCLSDLLPVVREQLETAPSFDLGGGDLLARLPELGMGGLQLKLSRAYAHATSEPSMRIDIRVDARIESQ
jgi:hypothetical protein